MLGELLIVIRGVSYKKEHASNEPAPDHVPILRATNIQDGLVFEDLVYVPRSYVSEEQILHRGDIIIAASSGSRSIVGKAAQLTTEWSGSFGAFCFGLRPKPGVNPGFLAWFLQTSEYRNRVSELSAGVNINNLRAKHIEETPIPLPPLDEQRRIVAEIEKQFTRLEAGVVGLLRVQANLKRYRAAVLKAACEGKLVATEAELARQEGRAYETGAQLLERVLTERRQKWSGKGKYKEPAKPAMADLPELPEGWIWASIEQLSAKVVDGVHKKPNYVSKGIPFVTVQNLTAGPGISFARLNYVTEKDHAEFWKRANPEKGDILVSKDGTLGVIRVVKTDATFSIFVSVALVKPVMLETTNYFAIALSSPQVQVQMVPKGSGLQHIHLEDLREDCVPLPPLAEQQRMVAEVERRLSVVEELEAVVNANLQRATRLRQSILQRALEGGLVPRYD